MFHEKVPKDYYVEIDNSSGNPYDFEDLILFLGSFGQVVSKDGIPDGERGLIDSTPNRTLTTDQLDGGATFALDAYVYSEEGKDLLLDAPTASTWRIGRVLRVKGVSDNIEFITLVPQIEVTP